MTDSSPKHTENVPLISYVTRRLIIGKKHHNAQAIESALGVKISAPNETLNETQSPLIKIVGPQKNVRAACEVIRQLDQKAKIIADREGLSRTGDVRPEHSAHLQVDRNNLLKPAIKELGLPALKKPQKAGPAFDAAAAQEKRMAEPPKPTAPTKPRFDIRFRDAFAPRNASQALMHLACKDRNNDYVFASGPFGGGKTISPLAAGLELYTAGEISEVIVIRPPTTASKHNPGAMPGDARKKDAPYTNSGIASNISTLTHHTMDELIKHKVVRAMTPIFEIGETYKNAFVLVDEAQNLNRRQVELMAGRLGEGSIMVFVGDFGGRQNDLPNEIPGLAHLIATQGKAAMKNRVLGGRTAYVAFQADDSAARNSILPHVSRAFTNPEEEYASLLEAFDAHGRNPALVAIIDKTVAYAQQALEKAAEMTLNRYDLQLKSQYPGFFAENTNVTPFSKARGTKPVARPA